MPLISNDHNIIDLDNITDILRDTPEIPTEFVYNRRHKQTNSEEDLTDIKNILNRNNGSVEDASSVITEIMHQSQYDNTRIKAAEIVLDLHEIRNKDGKLNKQPIINFNIVSSEVQIANVFGPHTYRSLNSLSESSQEEI